MKRLIYLLLLLAVLNSCAFAVDVDLNNKDLVVKELSACEKQDLENAQTTLATAQKELDRVKSVIAGHYSDNSTLPHTYAYSSNGSGYTIYPDVYGGYNCKRTQAEVHGKYVYVWSYDICAVILTNAGGR